MNPHFTEKDLSLLLKFNLQKHNSSVDEFNIKVINDIIYDEHKRIVSIFKEYLLLDEVSDFLKRFYYIYESRNRILKICDYYLDILPVIPNYSVFSQKYILMKNLHRKRKLYEQIQQQQTDFENKKNNEYDAVENLNKNYSALLKSHLLSSFKTEKSSLLLGFEDAISQNYLNKNCSYIGNIVNTKAKIELKNVSYIKKQDEIIHNDSQFNLIIDDIQGKKGEILDEIVDNSNGSISRVLNLSNLENNGQVKKNNDKILPNKKKKI